MIMDCPRCGLTQPKDRYCAQCGLDVEAFLARPKPVGVRLLQNPAFHLTLIGLMIALVIGYIVYSRSGFVSREVHHMFGTPLTSREAADPDEAAEGSVPALDENAAPAATEDLAAGDSASAVDTARAPEVTAAAAAPAAADPKHLEFSFWEVARDTLAALIAGGEKIGEGNAGRVFLVREAGKTADALKAGARRLSGVRSLDLRAGAQATVVTPPSTPEPFQFGFALQITRWENREAGLRWDSQLVLSQPETPAEMANPNPVVKAVLESNLMGTGTLPPSGVLLVVFEPQNRRPRDEYLAKAGEGPWSVFSSEDFRTGVTEWVALVQLK